MVLTFSSYSVLSMTTVDLPLSAGSIMMESSCFSDQRAVFSALEMLLFGTFDDLIAPSISVLSWVASLVGSDLHASSVRSNYDVVCGNAVWCYCKIQTFRQNTSLILVDEGTYQLSPTWTKVISTPKPGEGAFTEWLGSFIAIINTFRSLFKASDTFDDFQVLIKMADSHRNCQHH